MSDFWDDFEADAQAEEPTEAEKEQYYLNAAAETKEQSKLEKRQLRQQRIAHCGEAYGRYMDPQTGKLTHGVYHCGVWRECPSCFDYRKNKLRGAAHRAILDARKADKKLKLVQADKRTVDKLTRGVDKSKYARYPGDDFDTLLIVEDECSSTGDVVSYDDVSELDWDTLAVTPEGRRMSGKLGRENAAPSDDVMKVKVTSFVLHRDTTKQQEKAALEATLKATAHLQPTTLAEVQKAVKTRHSVFVRELIKAGGKMLPGATRKISVKCDLTCINWERYTDNLTEAKLDAMMEDIDIPF